MGTALTQEQLAELGRAASLVVLALDADRSGQEAMLRAVRAAREKQIELQVVELPEQGGDPAELIAAEGAEAFEQRLAGAIEVERFQLRRVVADADLDSATGTDRAIEEARALIATTPDRSVLRDSLIREGADRFGVPESYLVPGPGDRPRPQQQRASAAPRHAGGDPGPALLDGDPGPEWSPPTQGAPSRGGRAQASEPSPAAVSLRPERAFVALCLASGDLGRAFLARLSEGHLSSGLATRAVAHLVANFDDPLAALPDDDPALGGLVAGMIAEADERGSATEAELQISFLALELRRVDRERLRATEQGDFERQRELTAARAAALRELESVSSQTA
jgi:DNA primase